MAPLQDDPSLIPPAVLFENYGRVRDVVLAHIRRNWSVTDRR
jgi:hypothetical protein